PHPQQKATDLIEQPPNQPENQLSYLTRDLFKKIRDAKGIFHAKMDSIRDRNGMDLTEAEDIKKRNINNLRYADDTTLMAESEEKLKSLLMKVKEESEKVKTSHCRDPKDICHGNIQSPAFEKARLLNSKLLFLIEIQGQHTLTCLSNSSTFPPNPRSAMNFPYSNCPLINYLCECCAYSIYLNCPWQKLRPIKSYLIILFMGFKRIIELKELGELSPHWDNLRKNVLTHCDQMLNMYQDILTELSKETGVKSMTSHIQSEMNFITGYQFIYYSPENTAKAKEVLSNINQLQPLIATHADLLLNSASQHSPDSLKNSLKMLSEKTELFVHAFKDQLVRSALLALYTARPGGVLTKPPSPKSGAEESSSQDPPLPMRRQDSIPHHSDYDEEEWLAGLVCGFIIKLHTSLYDPGFLEQLHTVGLIVQYEGLLSTYSEEIGMLEDMAVGISDLKKVAFKIIEATSNDVLPVITGRREHYVVEVKVPARMFESLPLQIKEGQLLHVYPVLFNVGINEQQTLAESLTLTQISFSPLLSGFSDISHFQEQNDLKGLLENLHQNIQAKKRKNVEIMWLAATICRKLNGIRFTCCKSAKDRTSMSVTLEQCSILRDEHQLHKDFFIRALDCMRRTLKLERYFFQLVNKGCICHIHVEI
ncbi:hypothetical protein FD755_017946, partial [Muntiacus reevesi]